MTNETEYQRKMKAVGTKLKSLRYTLRETLGLQKLPLRETFRDSRPKLIDMGNEQPQTGQAPQTQKVIVVDQDGNVVDMRESLVSQTNPQAQTPNQSIPAPSTPQQNLQPSYPQVRERFQPLQGGKLVESFRRGPIRESVGRLIDSISTRVSPLQTQSPQQQQRPPASKREPEKEEYKQTISAEVDNQKTRDSSRKSDKDIHVVE